MLYSWSWVLDLEFSVLYIIWCYVLFIVCFFGYIWLSHSLGSITFCFILLYVCLLGLHLFHVTQLFPLSSLPLSVCSIKSHVLDWLIDAFYSVLPTCLPFVFSCVSWIWFLIDFYGNFVGLLLSEFVIQRPKNEQLTFLLF